MTDTTSYEIDGRGALADALQTIGAGSPARLARLVELLLADEGWEITRTPMTGDGLLGALEAMGELCGALIYHAAQAGEGHEDRLVRAASRARYHLAVARGVPEPEPVDLEQQEPMRGHAEPKTGKAETVKAAEPERSTFETVPNVADLAARAAIHNLCSTLILTAGRNPTDPELCTDVARVQRWLDAQP